MNESSLKFTQDCLLIRGLKVEASVGVFEWEHEVLQSLVIDLEAQCDFTAAEKTDDIDDAISYADVSETISAVICSQHHKLLEHLAARVSDALFSEYDISALLLTIEKPGAVPKARSVGIRVMRQK